MSIAHVREIVVPGHRLGRNIDLDANAHARPFARSLLAVKSVTWARPGGGILDQGEVGSCTGNAATGALECVPNFPALPAKHPALNESEALKLYSAAEDIDGDGPYPPNDNGSTGPSVAQACVNAGLISDFEHFTDINSTLQALMVGPVIVGINWFTSFDTPSSAGLVVIARGATVRGGHEIVMRSFDASTNLLGLDNSWGTSFGVDGSFFMSVATFTKLLSQGGDTTAFVPLSGPTPTLVRVPGLDGHTAGYAHTALTALGLVPTGAATQLTTDVVVGTVPIDNTTVAAGSSVEIVAKHK